MRTSYVIEITATSSVNELYNKQILGILLNFARTSLTLSYPVS